MEGWIGIGRHQVKFEGGESESVLCTGAGARAERQRGRICFFFEIFPRGTPEHLAGCFFFYFLCFPFSFTNNGRLCILFFFSFWRMKFTVFPGSMSLKKCA
ncbi:hypothetical protein K457DRAFT_508032 [Linnemannia elongata AG-77]|uniref:Uncharacterized protein n=1 Tax=Linnemannia elongata AG-77 TaxID=1314771 RepID=A0A197JXF4_9FUNG|nr:hypothetical protein K457DRAFT_508032 [Linnemannia elongata AG-77]